MKPLRVIQRARRARRISASADARATSREMTLAARVARGFTLIELLVALTVFSVLMGMLFQIVQNALDPATVLFPRCLIGARRQFARPRHRFQLRSWHAASSCLCGAAPGRRTVATYQ